MKLSSKWYRHKIPLTALLMYFLLLHAGLMLCCPCGSGDSHVSYGHIDGQCCEHCSDTHERSMNFSAMAMESSLNHGHNCGCKEITVSNYLVKEDWISYRSIKPVRNNFSFTHFGDTIPYEFEISSRIQHFLSPLIGSSSIQSIRTVVLLV